MTDFETHPVGTADVVKRLRHRAEEDRAIQKNNEAVASALRGQMLLFDQGIRSDANTFAVRLGLDYENCAKKDAKLVKDWEGAADRIEQLEAALTRANAATAAAFEVAAEETPYESDRDAIRALATPDQTAALDRMIAEAVNTSMQGVERWEIPVQSIEHCIDRMVVTSSHDADTKKSLRLWLLSLAASKKVSKP